MDNKDFWEEYHDLYPCAEQARAGSEKSGG